jgi:hypothetical protein
MIREEKPVNPYEPPALVNDGIVGAVRSFRVGVEEIITVFVEASVWTGIRTYARDVESDSGPVHRGPCQFEVGTRERHEVTIEVDGTGRVNAYVDGQLVEANLFASLRLRIFSIVAVFMIVIFVLVLFVGALLFKA